MAFLNSIARENEEYGQAKVVARSRLYFKAPVVIIVLIALNLVWEVVRSNIPSHDLTLWPYRFTIMDDSTTATVLAVFVSLFMGRLQWARTMRPIAGMAIDDEGAKFRPDSDIWRVWIYNSGPGATISEITYYVRFADQPANDGVTNWVPLQVVNDQLKSRHLLDGIDYFMRWYANGAPFPPVKNYTEGMILAWLSVKALNEIRILDVKIRYVDSLGDTHEKITPIIQRLPSVAVEAVRRYTASIVKP
jgi:hypothetical protein